MNIPSYILYMGLTEAIFAPSEKELLSKSLFIMLADSFTNFGGIISGPVAFLMFMFFSTYLCRRLQLRVF